MHHMLTYSTYLSVYIVYACITSLFSCEIKKRTKHAWCCGIFSFTHTHNSCGKEGVRWNVNNFLGNTWLDVAFSTSSSSSFSRYCLLNREIYLKINTLHMHMRYIHQSDESNLKWHAHTNYVECLTVFYLQHCKISHMNCSHEWEQTRWADRQRKIWLFSFCMYLCVCVPMILPSLMLFNFHTIKIAT